MSTPVTDLPAVRVNPGPVVADPKVGDRVAVHSRGSYRLAEVTTVTPKRVTVRYTTAGAWTEAKRTVETYLAINVEKRKAAEAQQHGENYDFFMKEANPETSRYGVKEHYAKYVEEGKDAYVTRLTESWYKGFAACRALAEKEGAAGFVHVTTVTVPRAKVYQPA